MATTASASTASIAIPAKLVVQSMTTFTMAMVDADDNDDDDAFLDEEPQTHELAADPALRCRYPSKHCARRRTTKKTGALHSMCAFHRAKANRNQRRLEKRKRFQKDEARLRSQQFGHNQYNQYQYQHMGVMGNTMTMPTSAAAHYDHYNRQSMVMLPTVSSSSAQYQHYSSPRDVDADVGGFAHLEPFRTPVPLFKEDLEELSALVDFNVMGIQVSYAPTYAYAHEDEEASQSRIV